MQGMCVFIVTIMLNGISEVDDIDGEAASDKSGFSVSLSSDGTKVAIGAHVMMQMDLIQGMCVFISIDFGSWVQLGSDIDGEAADDQLGYSVSLSSDGTKVAIGAHCNDGGGSNSGHVRVYEYASSSWSQLGADIDGEAAGDKSGFSVSLSSDGTKVAIGAPYNDGGGSNSGHARVYEYASSSWSQLAVILMERLLLTLRTFCFFK